MGGGGGLGPLLVPYPLYLCPFVVSLTYPLIPTHSLLVHYYSQVGLSGGALFCLHLFCPMHSCDLNNLNRSFPHIALFVWERTVRSFRLVVDLPRIFCTPHLLLRYSYGWTFYTPIPHYHFLLYVTSPLSLFRCCTFLVCLLFHFPTSSSLLLLFIVTFVPFIPALCGGLVALSHLCCRLLHLFVTSTPFCFTPRSTCTHSPHHTYFTFVVCSRTCIYTFPTHVYLHTFPSLHYTSFMYTFCLGGRSLVRLDGDSFVWFRSHLHGPIPLHLNKSERCIYLFYTFTSPLPPPLHSSLHTLVFYLFPSACVVILHVAYILRSPLSHTLQ